ncbi:MAG: K(+)-transporting ATPase subunit C [Deltaproteobacteria bacterium]|nr:K(+)-transporting ATPase subunit C [Deltaproteobacteria bacterium]
MKTSEYLKELRMALASVIVLAVILCGAYPLAVWGIGQALFPNQANGTLIQLRGKTVGSSLIAQGFKGAAYFHPRPSAAGQGYDSSNSGGSNLGPTSQKLIDSVKERIAVYRLENNLTPEFPVPADAVTSSGSGLDPHISVQNARLQAPRVAKVRNMSQETLRQKIDIHTEGRDLGMFGEPRVNVLNLNLELDSGR